MASHIYSSFTKWYFTKLKAAPLLTNLSTGVVLMTGGDVLAQRVESGDDPTTCSVCEDGYDSVEAVEIRRSLQAEHNIISTTNADNEHHDDDLQIFDMDSIFRASLLDRQDDYVQTMKEELAFWNPFRTGTMAGWAFVYIPFYVSVYKSFDRFLPKKTPTGVLARVGLSFCTSIPVNAAFYAYGTAIDHTQQWLARPNTHRDAELSTNPLTSFKLDELWEKTRWKLQNELPKTIQMSGACWIPVNLVLFSVVPSHMQPLSLMFFSFFWNCYLSMSQHRSNLTAASMLDEAANKHKLL